jgi:predicted amidohydrolase
VVVSGDKKRIALAQLSHHDADIDAAVEQHIAWIAEARHASCDVVLFPELSLCPYACNGNTLGLAIPRFHDVINRLAQASEGIMTVFGFVEEGAAAQFYNSSAAVRDGRVVFVHRKINLPNYGRLEEGKHFATGRYVETFDLGWPWRASILTCADLWNPALVHLSAVHGATLLLAPIASSLDAVGSEFDNPVSWDLAARFYAMIYGMPVAICNRVGSEAGAVFWGGSALIDPFGTVIERAGGEEEQLLVGEIDFQNLRRARYQLPTVRDSNLALIQHEINRLGAVLGVPVKD